MKKGQSQLGEQRILPLGGDRPILAYLAPVRIESWREEGLFMRTRHGVVPKMRFLMRVRSQAFDYNPRGMAEARNSQSNVSRQEIMMDKKLRAVRKFDAVRNDTMREIMIRMIIAENLQTARYVAKKAGIPWPQFKIDFNEAVDAMMDAAQTQGGKYATRSV